MISAMTFYTVIIATIVAVKNETLPYWMVVSLLVLVGVMNVISMASEVKLREAVQRLEEKANKEDSRDRP